MTRTFTILLALGTVGSFGVAALHGCASGGGATGDDDDGGGHECETGVCLDQNACVGVLGGDRSCGLDCSAGQQCPAGGRCFSVKNDADLVYAWQCFPVDQDGHARSCTPADLQGFYCNPCENDGSCNPAGDSDADTDGDTDGDTDSDSDTGTGTGTGSDTGDPPDPCEDVVVESGNFCLTNDGGATAWCGVDCSGGEACPAGSECADIGDGSVANCIVARQCVPTDGTCDTEQCDPFCLPDCDSNEFCAGVPSC